MSLGWMHRPGRCWSGASVAFPLLVGQATMACAGSGSLLHAHLWRNRDLPDGGVLFSQN